VHHADAGNLKQVTDARAGFAQGFTYDVIDRLESVTGLGSESFEYDARGNRSKRNRVALTYDSKRRRPWRSPNWT
jgi:hypothetical protein